MYQVISTGETSRRLGDHPDQNHPIEEFDFADFSSTYADQNERDFKAFTAAVNSGRLQAQTGL